MSNYTEILFGFPKTINLLVLVDSSSKIDLTSEK